MGNFIVINGGSVAVQNKPLINLNSLGVLDAPSVEKKKTTVHQEWQEQRKV